MTREEICKLIDEICGEETEVILADGYDDAFIGVAERFGYDCAVYDLDKVLKTLQGNGDMTKEEALEFYEFNIGGDFVGESTPVFMKYIVKEEHGRKRA